MRLKQRLEALVDSVVTFAQSVILFIASWLGYGSDD